VKSSLVHELRQKRRGVHLFMLHSLFYRKVEVMVLQEIQEMKYSLTKRVREQVETAA
jgi:hypothetical protein